MYELYYENAGVIEKIILKNQKDKDAAIANSLLRELYENGIIILKHKPTGKWSQDKIDSISNTSKSGDYQTLSVTMADDIIKSKLTLQECQKIKTWLGGEKN